MVPAHLGHLCGMVVMVVHLLLLLLMMRRLYVSDRGDASRLMRLSRDTFRLFQETHLLIVIHLDLQKRKYDKSMK